MPCLFLAHQLGEAVKELQDIRNIHAALDVAINAQSRLAYALLHAPHLGQHRGTQCCCILQAGIVFRRPGGTHLLQLRQIAGEAFLRIARSGQIMALQIHR